MKVRTIIPPALALLAVAATTANANPTSDAVRASHLSHRNIPWDTRVTLQKPLLRCTVEQNGQLVAVSRHRCGDTGSGAIHNA